MTIGQVESAELIQRKQQVYYRVRAWEHKTTQSFGSASIVVPFDIFAMLKTYIESVREGSGDGDVVFISNSGNPIAKAGNEMNMLAKALGEELPVITPSLNRKILSTEAAGKLEDEGVRKVAAHMTHDITTAKKYYHIQNDKETAVDAFQLLNDSVSN